MSRYLLLATTAALLAIAPPFLDGAKRKQDRARTTPTKLAAAPFNVVEATIPEMRTAMEQGRVTSRELVTQYLVRIGMYEDKLHAVMTVNPNAFAEADERDRERAQGKVRGPLHGIPIALKDNILTHDIVTTGGALAFEGFLPPYDATLVRNLRDAGAVIIAKTTLSELANWVAGAPTPMPGNYNAIREFAYNPYDPRRDPREATADGRPALQTGGSSSGAGTAASFWAANVGSETSGSILSPSNQNMLAAIKPTVGRISRYGVIPITADQDTAGPMGRTVTDVAILFGALESLSPDPNDPATKTCTPPPARDYTRFLKADGLRGARIGIPRAFFYDRTTPPGPIPANLSPPRTSREGATAPEASPSPTSGAGPSPSAAATAAPFGGRGGGLTPEQARLMTEAIDILKQQGAVIVDPSDIPSIVSKDADNNFLLWGQCSGYNNVKGKDANCSAVLKYGMKRDFNKWLGTLGSAAPLKTLTQLREWNITHINGGAIRYGQSNLDISDEMDIETDRARYEHDRAKDIALAGTHGIDQAMKENHLDALLFPGANGAAIAAKPGYPTVIVPFATVPNSPTPPFPPQFEAKPSPFGVAFTGLSCSEPRLIELGYAFEQASKRRVPPASTP